MSGVYIKSGCFVEDLGFVKNVRNGGKDWILNIGVRKRYRKEYI